LILARELEKLQRNLGGIRNLAKLPDSVFIIDTKKEHIAVTEANKLGLPIVAVVDTNCDPDVIQYVIPGNDDAIRAGTLMCRILSDAVKEGSFIASRRSGAPAGGPPPTPDPAAEERRAREQAEARRQAALQAPGCSMRSAPSRRARGTSNEPDAGCGSTGWPAPVAAATAPAHRAPCRSWSTGPARSSSCGARRTSWPNRPSSCAWSRSSPRPSRRRASRPRPSVRPTSTS